MPRIEEDGAGIATSGVATMQGYGIRGDRALTAFKLKFGYNILERA
jgi:hypothetical protein